MRTAKPTVAKLHIDEASAAAELGMGCQRLFDNGGLGAMACFLPPHASSAPDCHPDNEAMIVLSGDGVVECAGERRAAERYRLAHDDVLIVPGGVSHAMHNEADKPLVWLAIYWLTPRRPEGPAA